MNRERYDVSTLEHFVGQELGVSNWLTVDQERINEFADCTGDHQWIHADRERTQRESPLGSTIAHGYLTLSLLAAMQMEFGIVPEDVTQALNYGLDRVRFIAHPGGARGRRPSGQGTSVAQNSKYSRDRRGNKVGFDRRGAHALVDGAMTWEHKGRQATIVSGRITCVTTPL
jgi:hypothetical protein